MAGSNGKGPLQNLIDSCANDFGGWLGQRGSEDNPICVLDPIIYPNLPEEGNGCIHCPYAGEVMKTKHGISYFPCKRPQRTS